MSEGRAHGEGGTLSKEGNFKLKKTLAWGPFLPLMSP